MRKVVLLLIIALSLFLYSGNILSLEEAQNLARSNNPELRASEASLNSAKKSLQSSYFSYGPSATFNYNKLYMNPEIRTVNSIIDETATWQLSASQPIFNGGKVILGNSIAKNTYRISEESYRSKLLEITAEVESKYYSVQSNKELVLALEKTLEQSELNLEIARVKYESGLISKADLLQLESSKLSSELDLINLQNALKLSILDLADYIGASAEIDVEEFRTNDYEIYIEKLRNLDAGKQTQLINNILQVSEQQNPTLIMARLGTDTADKSRLMTGGNMLPSLNLSYSYKWENSNYNSAYEGSSTFGIIASVPIFPVADNALDYQAAVYDLKSSEAQETSTENAIQLGVRSSALSMITSAKSVESAKLSKEYAWETWEQMRERFEQGLVSTSDLLSIEILVTTSDNNYVNSRQNFLTSLSGLTQMLGFEDKDELLKIIDDLEE